MPKPKITRQSIENARVGKGFYEWLNDNGYNSKDWDRSNEAIKKASKETGKTEQEIYTERVQLSMDIQEEYEIYLDGEKDRASGGITSRNNTLDSVVSVYQRADRILTGLNVLVSVSETEVAPAYNDGKDIVFSGKLIKELDENTVLSLQGLNYHELGHLLFTPRVGTALGKWVGEKVTKTKSYVYGKDSDGNDLTHTYTDDELAEPMRNSVFNILEDCRAEYYLTLKYPSVRPFMVALLGDYLLDNKTEKLGEQFILLAGRKYFSQELRKMSAQMFISKYGFDKAQAIYEIINEYRTLVFPRQYDRAKELITALIALLPRDENGKPELLPNNPNGCTYRAPMRNGRPIGEKEQEGLLDLDGDKTDNLFGGLSAGNEAGEETGEVNPDTADFINEQSEVVEQLNEAVNRAKADKSLQRKVIDTLKAIQKDRSSKSTLEKGRASNFTPEMSEVTASRLFAQELELLRIESDPAWDREKPSGKLNVRRAMNADINQIDRLFDRWSEGNDDYDIEASILIDKSGSMWSLIGSACRSAWVIKRGIERINGKVSVSAFSYGAKEIYDRDTPANASVVRVVEAGGGTDPIDSLNETRRIMENTNAKTKLVFILTDGEWSNSAVCDQKIANLVQQGCYVSVVWLGNEDYAKQILSDPKTLASYTHNASDFRTIQNPNELVKVARDVVKHQIKSRKVRG